MSIPHVLIQEGQSCSASGKLLALRRANARGQEGFMMDIRMRFDAVEDDAAILQEVFVGVGELFAQNRRWSGELKAKPSRTVKLEIVDLGGKPVIDGVAVIQSIELVCRDITRAFEFKARVSVEEGFVARVDLINTLVTVTLEGAKQEPKKKGKGKVAKKDQGQDQPGQLKLVGGTPPIVPDLVLPLPGQVIEIRTGTKASRWALAFEVSDLGQDSEVICKDIADGRTKERLPALKIASAVDVVAPAGENLTGMLNRYRSAVNKAKHGRPASWTNVMAAWAQDGRLHGKARIIDQDVLDRAAEMLVQEAAKTERLNQQRGIELPPPADDELPAAAEA